MEKVSVIVPVYNVEKYIKRCLESIINQAYTNLEIILVNDGSTDASRSVCEEYCQKDPRIIILDKKNGGLSDARNYGLDRCSGDYVFFIDSDDYMSTNCIKRLYDNIVKTESDIATALFAEFDESEKPKEEQGKEKTLKTEKALEWLLYRKRCTTSAWGKLYKKDLFKDIRYPVGKICEDLPVTYKLFAKAKRVSIDSSKLYYYLLRKNSIIRSEFKPARFEALGFAEEETSFIKRKYPKLIKAALNREFMESVYIQRSIFGSKEINTEYYEKTKNAYNKLRSSVIRDIKAPLESKLYALLGSNGIKMLVRRKNV